VTSHWRAGKHHFTSETKAPICSPSGTAIGLVGISRDATERVKTSQELRECEAALEQQTRILNSILDTTDDGVVVIARDGRNLLFSAEAGRLLGVATRDVRADAWAETYGLYLDDGEIPLPVEKNPLCRAMAGEPLVRMELSIKNPVVARPIVAFTAAPLRDANGAVIGAIALLRDVTRSPSQHD
jgi:PAS domain-containing protein